MKLRAPKDSFALLSIIVLVTCNRAEREYHFADYKEALAGMPAGAGLPPFVPETATDIFLLKNIETNAVWSCFRTPAPGAIDVIARLIRSEALTHPLGAGPGRQWWPPSMATPGQRYYRYVYPGPPEPSVHRHDTRAEPDILIGIDTTGQVCFQIDAP